MEPKTLRKENGSSPNFTLLMTSLESQIVDGRNLENCHEILDRKNVWSRLGVPEQMKWARLAQMAGKVKRLLMPMAQILNKDLSSFHLEVFPKQDKLTGKGLGNLVKLPLGIHRQTGKRSYFVECSNRNVENQLAFLMKIEPSLPGIFDAPSATPLEKKVVVHPRWQKWSEDYPELFELERLCPPLGQIFALCRNGKPPTNREEKILLQTVGFLPRAGELIHCLMAPVPEYNPHLVDFKLSRLRGTPLGCKRIHSLLEFHQDICTFEKTSTYAHPLLHLPQYEGEKMQKSERIENLNAAMENLRTAITQVQRFMT